ncbi:hypothetical protein [Cellulomonas wangsupingiae]|uniref:Lipoprotein n=1 Tax=Cellulomonas wangsupingiae TaxID=2968085 RepID=A0ABY5K8U3_9CELL|nr:hypothetical protein [Cellulomonas wangsupingiae]MCC2333156.1 hypothetical protein [Cellulomonas wangsupingiae]MCM0641334.1 hypothetical protein [Cellulomonas wangsupingiae]UUI66871.1 hypothetical protein NP075_09270 [Cellulomonas wangsupingiae]
MRRRTGGVVGAVLAVVLTGCVIDVMPSGPLLVNLWTDDVELHVVGTDRVEAMPADDQGYVDVEECEGTALRLQRGDDVLGEYEGALCPGMTVTVQEDGTVSVYDGEEWHTPAPG